MGRLLALVVAVLGVVCLGLGIFFVYQGMSKNNFLVMSLRQEKITLGLTQGQIDAGQLDDNADALQKASDKVRADRHNIASTYTELTGGKNFDPTNTKELTWAQALNLENSLNLSILALGVIQIVEAAGAFMIVVAIALLVIGIVLWRLSGKALRLEY
jgi:hypothetical protein